MLAACPGKRARKKCALPPAATELLTSTSAPPFQNKHMNLSHRCFNHDTSEEVSGEASRCVPHVASTCAASLRSSARMLQLRLEPTCKLPLLLLLLLLGEPSHTYTHTHAHTHTNTHTETHAHAAVPLRSVYAPGREPQCVSKPRPLLGNGCEMTS